MTTREEALSYGLSFPDTYQDAPFHDDNWQLIRIRKNKKAFMWVYEREDCLCVNLKVDPELKWMWRDAYETVIPGYHQNKDHWNTVILNGTIPREVIEEMITDSYNLVKPKNG